MRADGADAEQVTSDEFAAGFLHPSPDGKWLVFSLAKRRKAIENKTSRFGSCRSGRRTEVLAKLFGGRARSTSFVVTDSRRVAFVSYQLVP
jgi:hypothetical protein